MAKLTIRSNAYFAQKCNMVNNTSPFHETIQHGMFLSQPFWVSFIAFRYILTKKYSKVNKRFSATFQVPVAVFPRWHHTPSMFIHVWFSSSLESQLAITSWSQNSKRLPCYKQNNMKIINNYHFITSSFEISQFNSPNTFFCKSSANT